MNEPLGIKVLPVNDNPDAPPPIHEPEVELPRAAELLPTPASAATSLLAPITPPWFSPLPPSLVQRGGGSVRASPSLFQATVESAPPTPRIEPEETGREDPAAFALEEGPEEGHEDRMEERGDREQERPGGVGEPPTLIYVPPSPGQIRRGEPLTGWLCEPGWIRRRLRDFTQGNMRGDQS